VDQFAGWLSGLSWGHAARRKLCRSFRSDHARSFLLLELSPSVVRQNVRASILELILSHTVVNATVQRALQTVNPTNPSDGTSLVQEAGLWEGEPHNK
jgi:hypothetical protein